MLLKIEVHDECQDYWLLDKIDKISKSGTLYWNNNDAEEVDMMMELCSRSDIKIMNHTNESDGRGQGKYIKLICRKENGDEFSVMFDTIAYICNDEGKTIEKIPVNDDNVKRIKKSKVSIMSSPNCHGSATNEFQETASDFAAGFRD